jgi:membrane dipeptidase
MAQGGLDGGFFVIYTAQGPLTPQAYAKVRDQALMRAVAIQRVMAENRDRIGLATTAADAERLNREGKRIAFQSIENSYPLGTDLSLLTTFHQLGVRMASPVHNGPNQFSDSARGDRVHGGLSPLGRQWLAEMNRLGMIVDGSHASDEAIDQMIGLSRTPLILSHHGRTRCSITPQHSGRADAQARPLRRGDADELAVLIPGESVPERDTIEKRQERWDQLSRPSSSGWWPIRRRLMRAARRGVPISTCSCAACCMR